MSIAEKLTTVAENQEQVFEAGKKAEYDRFWDGFQQNGKRPSYSFAFREWQDDIFYPKYSIKLTWVEGVFMSCKCTDIMKRFEDKGLVFDTTGATCFRQAFQDCLSKSVPYVDFSKVVSSNNSDSAFSYCQAETIHIKISNNTSFNANTFTGTSKLENLIIDGELAKNGLQFSTSNALTHESLMNIVNCLKDYSDYTGTTVYKVTLGSTNLNKLTNEEKAIATEKGWTLA